LHLSHANHVVRHNLLRQILALGDNGNLARLACFDLPRLVIDLQVLLRDLLVHTSGFLHECHVDVGSLSILPSLESHAALVPSQTIHGTRHEFASELELPDVLAPRCYGILERVVAAHEVKPVATGINVVLTLGSLRLRAELVQPVAETMLLFSLLENDHSLVETLDSEGTVNPFVVGGSHILAVKHVANAFELARLHATRSNDLFLSDLLLLAQLVAKVLIIVHNVLSHDHHLHVDALVRTLLPLHESPVKTALVLLNQAQLHTSHVVAIVLAILLPDHEGLVHNITVLKVALAQGVILCLRRRLLGQAFTLVLELLALGDLRLEDGSRRLKLLIGVGELDSVEALLQQSIFTDALNVSYKSFLASEELVLTALLAPVFPSLELTIGHLLTLLLHSMPESQEHSLLEGCVRDNLAEHLLLLLHVFIANRGDPLNEGLAFGTLGATPAYRQHKVLLGVGVLAEVSPAAEVVAQFELGRSTAHAINHLDGVDLVGIDALPV